jgi:hypothetical protein
LLYMVYFSNTHSRVLLAISLFSFSHPFFIQPSICLSVAVIVIKNFCATVNGPSYHILVMTSSRGYGPFCI